MQLPKLQSMRELTYKCCDMRARRGANYRFVRTTSLITTAPQDQTSPLAASASKEPPRPDHPQSTSVHCEAAPPARAMNSENRASVFHKPHALRLDGSLAEAHRRASITRNRQ